MASAPSTGNTDEVINLVMYVASPQQRWLAGTVSVVLIAAAALAFPFARHPLPVIPALLPAFAISALFTYSLLTSQFRVSRAPALVVLASTYLFAGLIGVPQIMTYDGVSMLIGLPPVEGAASFWFWVLCHIGFPLGTFGVLIVEQLWGHLRPTRRQLNALTLYPLLGVLGLVGGFTFIVLRFPEWLPMIIQDENYTFLITSGVGPVIWGLNIAVFAVLLLIWRGRTVGHLWLTVAALAMLLDVTLTFAGARRFSIGWYTGEMESLLGATIVFIAFLFETHRHYDRVVGQGRELRAIFDSSPVGIARMDLDGRTLETNPALCAMLAYDDTALRVVPLDALMPAADAMRDCEYRVELLTGDRDYYDLETPLIPQVGERFWGQVHVSLVRGRRGEPLYFVAMVQDVSARKRHEESIVWQAYHDSLTGLPNRLAVDERLARTGADDEEVWLAVVYLDLNGFKQVNDTLGHDAGDDVLCEVARRLAECVRTGDLAARIGGDEFVLLLPASGVRDDLDIVVSRVHAVFEQPINVRDQSVSVGASIGVSVFPDAGTDLHSLIAKADAAMYRVKAIERNLRIAAFSEASDD